MRNKQYQLSKVRRTLKERERNGVPYVIWKLSPEQKEEVEKWWYTEEYLYSIRTRQFPNIRDFSSNLLKDLHYARKRGKLMIVRKLKEPDKEVLEEQGIRYYPIKFKIYLRRGKASA